ncbi:ATP-binding transport protein [Yersinia pseudotuberculosis]|nr:ATP-binding transport protein [Yersinia pseudotuberculosis]CNB29559.1 ATP-binding transport protein [Yersinia pseudotuberculosis]CNB34317.1 ATP-binding transport protein [Yersinia pseudotuberculosis]CRY58430.1 ATP-binding transport protein [Yersinia pseudotuberculosis]
MSHPVFVRPELVVDNVTVTYNNGHTAIITMVILPFMTPVFH